jgi:membrane dipeptidase
MELAEAEVRRIHHDALTIDAHVDIFSFFNDPEHNAGEETKDQLDLPKLERGDLDVAVIALHADPAQRTPESIAAARAQVDKKLKAVQGFIAQHPDRLELATSAADLERIPASGKHAILLSFSNALALGKDISLIDAYYEQGIRQFTFAHLGNNDLAYSSRPAPFFGDDPNEVGGLTELGKQALMKLNRLGIIVDVSQLTTQGLFQAVELSEAPVIASHSAIRKLVDTSRNLTDEELKAVANTEGVVHIVAMGGYVKTVPPSTSSLDKYINTVIKPFNLEFLKDDARVKLDPMTYNQYLEAAAGYYREAWREGGDLTDYVNAIDYAVELIGIDHVGISSDFNHAGGLANYSNEGEAPNVTQELVRHGYSEAEIQKLWGANYLRVFQQVEAFSKK